MLESQYWPLPYKVLFTESAKTSGFPSRSEVDGSVSLPMETTTTFLSEINVNITNTTVNQLWLFPNMTFECNGAVTEWRFRANEATSNPATCPQFQAWRSMDTQFVLIQNTTNATNCSCVNSTNGVCTYSLRRSPIDVERGDFLGVFFPLDHLDLQFYVDKAGSTTSYQNITNDNDINVINASSLTETTYLPLIYPEIVPSEYIYIHPSIHTCVHTLKN